MTVEIRCERCDESFETSPSKAEKLRQCSPCYQEYGWLDDTREKHREIQSKEPETVECKVCETTFECKPSQAEIRIVCSRECYREHLSREYSGEDSWHWQGGISNYPPEFSEELRERVRERDDRECQRCGSDGSAWDMKLFVHHIDGNRDNNDPENLQTVCPSCHAKIHDVIERLQ